MKRFIVPLATFALLALVLAVGLNRVNTKRDGANRVIISSPLLGKAAPAFALPDLLNAQQTIDAATLKGGWHLLNVWGTWCSECAAEHANLMEIQTQARVAIVGLDWKDDDAAAIAWLAQRGNPYVSVPADRAGKVAIDYGVYGAPESFLINPEGIVVEKQIGGIDMATWRSKFLPHLNAAAKGVP
jgi:cytochrome c biogenesis protein CcmG, thiol:disulfide interchange protein DsbE